VIVVWGEIVRIFPKCQASFCQIIRLTHCFLRKCLQIKRLWPYHADMVGRRSRGATSFPQEPPRLAGRLALPCLLR